ncbi:MAG TPA: hypothetical protein VGZ73_28735 [Bryobacteraceae bacterium]|nr:hypothetical protein [Bryobacteraceae bacterium]
MILRLATRASLPLMMALCSIAPAQTPQSTILTIEMENVVQYQESFANPQKNGTSTAMEVSSPPATFFPGTFIADIVAVNGRKSKGATVGRNYWVGLNSNPSASQAIADITRFQAMEVSLEIQQADGTSVGTIVLTGVTGGPPALGAPRVGVTGTFAVVGGTGAFLGARGQAATIMNSHRAASTFENPINRRTFQSGLWKLVVQLIPMATPEIVVTSTGPAIVHSSDYSPVTAANPAHAGEVLTLFAARLGPTRPGVDPGQVFTASPVQVVNSPIDVLVNGKAGDVLYAGGYPNSVDNYQVNFRIPGDTAPGMAAIQLSAAWIAGTEVRIPVQ